ncbi:hypothetical protein MGMO_172c00090 [Methyloglobulus morosus KoM1]|uniref:DUF1993 domain-containing protein n=1 Tax=Methyloglobulus morosus KoM1 TaxID=1116472 RepID=V5BRC0_9GAMM|nr:DUF1993 domain-containing protein [Methyloglobulus morosus]ESS67093.1 hypothetical protein MGMO_172c00090 [Methyloglobulus morosus KoM1]
MSISMYEASIPHFVLMLGNLSLILDKAKAHCETKNIDESVFVQARLASDMYPLSQQIRIITDMAKACAARLAGVEIPRYEDNETTFADYQARIAKTIAFLQGFDSEQIDNSYNLPITMKLYDKEVVYTAQVYLLDVVIPHFYFHVTTAYAILRHHGVELGKKDYMNNE